MKWEEIYDYTLQAVEKDEMYELLMGEGEYKLISPDINCPMPSYFNDYVSIIYNGIYKVHETHPEKRTKINKAYSKALKKIINANYLGIYYASYILFTTLRWDKKDKSAFVVNLLHLEMLNDQIHLHMDELKKCTDYGGSMLDDIERLDRILMDETNTSLFDRRYSILKKLNQALNPNIQLIQRDKVSDDYWDYDLCGVISEEKVKQLLENTLTPEEKGYCGLIENYCIRIRQPYGWWRKTCPPEIVK